MCGSGSRRLLNTEPIQIRIYYICLKDFDLKKYIPGTYFLYFILPQGEGAEEGLPGPGGQGHPAGGHQEDMDF